MARRVIKSPTDLCKPSGFEVTGVLSAVIGWADEINMTPARLAGPRGSWVAPQLPAASLSTAASIKAGLRTASGRVAVRVDILARVLGRRARLARRPPSPFTSQPAPILVRSRIPIPCIHSPARDSPPTCITRVVSLSSSAPRPAHPYTNTRPQTRFSNSSDPGHNFDHAFHPTPDRLPQPAHNRATFEKTAELTLALAPHHSHVRESRIKQWRCSQPPGYVREPQPFTSLP